MRLHKTILNNKFKRNTLTLINTNNNCVNKSLASNIVTSLSQKSTFNNNDLFQILDEYRLLLRQHYDEYKHVRCVLIDDKPLLLDTNTVVDQCFKLIENY